MISRSGSMACSRLPVAVYRAATSVAGSPLPQVGVSARPPTVVRRGSLYRSAAATRGLAAYRVTIVVQAAVNFAAGQLSLYQSPFRSSSEQHQPPNSWVQLRTTISPAPVRAATQASNTCSGVDPYRSGLARRYWSGTAPVCSVIQTLNSSRTLLNPSPATVRASVSRCTRSRPALTPWSSWAPNQFAPASLTRRPSAPTMNRPVVDSGVTTAMAPPPG